MTVPGMRGPAGFGCAVFLVLTLVCGRAALISEVQHMQLPVLQKTVVFVTARPPNYSDPQFANVTFNPGKWREVAVIAWKPPIATISGYRFDTLFETMNVHILSFPPELRPQVAEAARANQSLLAKSRDDKESLLLKDGTVLRKYSVARAFPGGAWIEHEGGTRVATLADLPTAFFKTHRVHGPYLYFRELEFPPGEKLIGARVAVAKGGQNCRITHDAGSRAARFADLPEDLQALLKEHLVDKEMFADEIVVEPVMRERRPVREIAAASTPTPVPTPAAILQKISLGSYATLPLKDGKVLIDARFLSLDADGVDISSKNGSRRIRYDLLPDEVRAEIGESLVPVFGELLEHGLVAKDRCPIYAMESEGDAVFTEAAKSASGGTVVARVGVGFLVQEGRWKGNGGGAVQLPKPLHGLTRGFVLEDDFVHLGRRSWREWWLAGRPDLLAGAFDEDQRRQMKFQPVPLGADAVLLDPFEGRSTMFGNRNGVMKRAWRLSPSTRPNLAIVETHAGFYLGVLTERMELPESKMTWEQLLAHRSGAYCLEKVNQRTIQKGAALFQVEASDSEAQAFVQSPERARVLPGHYRTLVEKGMESLVAALDVAQEEGVEVATAENAGNYGKEKEVVVERITLQFESLSADSAVVTVVVQQREREVERRRDREGSVSMTQGQWRAKKLQRAREVELDADGGLRFTDGKAIYALSFPKVGGFQLSTYEVTSNSLSKAAH